MKGQRKYAVVLTKVTNENTEIEQGTLVEVSDSDAFMQKIRILKREETLYPHVLKPLSGFCSLAVGTLDKVEMILDIVYGINDGDKPEIRKAECLTALANVRKDIIGCSQAVYKIENAKTNYLYYCKDKDDYYYCGENCLKHLGLALMWAFGFMNDSIQTYKKQQLQPV
jgi:hypothetical protein